MTYISKTIDVDVEVEIADVLEFIDGARDEEKRQILERVKGDGRKESPAPYYVPVFVRGHAYQLIALGRLEELIASIGLEAAVERLAQ